MVKNVILITVDCLRADHLSCYGYYRKTSPYLDELAEKGILFTQAFSNGPWTPLSFPSILTSTYPLQYSPFDYHLSPKRLMLSEVLKQNGYLTGAFHSNPYLSNFYGYNRGFDIFYDSIFTEERIKVRSSFQFLTKVKTKLERSLGQQNFIYRLLYRVGGEIIKKEPKWRKIKRAKRLREIDEKIIESASTINTKVISWLKDVKEPFFLWVHYMDVRMGYLPPEKCLEYYTHFSSSLPNKARIRELSEKVYRTLYAAKERFSDDEIKLLIDLYDAEVRYVDEHIKLLLDNARKMRLLDETLVIITADHGDEFLEHGDIGHHSKLYDELLHVPLIIYAPELDKNIVIDDLVSLLDLAPTILDILNIKKPEQWVGESLLTLIEGKRTRENMGVISEALVYGRRRIAYRTKKWKLIVDEGKNTYELYNLEEDPKELNNVAEEYPNLVEEFSLKIRKHILMEEKTKEDVEKDMIKRTIKNLKAKSKI